MSDEILDTPTWRFQHFETWLSPNFARLSMNSSPDTERVSLKRTLISQGRCPFLMPDTRCLWTALTQEDVIGTQTQSSSPVSGPIFALIFDRGKGCWKSRWMRRENVVSFLILSVSNWVGELLILLTASSSLTRDRKKCLNSAQQWEQKIKVAVSNFCIYWVVFSPLSLLIFVTRNK